MTSPSIYHIYLDESGDLGFLFDSPYRQGGSSRYLTIAFLLIPEHKKHLSKRIIKKLYQRKKIPSRKELKGVDLNADDRIFFANQTISLLNRNRDIKACAITVYKKNVKQNIRRDPNKLYNYMVKLALLDRIKNISKVIFIPDKRSIKLESGNSLVDYLQTQLIFECNSDTVIENQPMESDKVLNLQFAHWLTHLIWKKYEDRTRKVSNILNRNVELHHLFFPK